MGKVYVARVGAKKVTVKISRVTPRTPLCKMYNINVCVWSVPQLLWTTMNVVTHVGVPSLPNLEKVYVARVTVKGFFTEFGI